MTAKWITFDCFGTLIDWNSGFSSVLARLAGEQTHALMQAYHRFEREIEAQRPHRLYKEVLTKALLLGAREVGTPISESEAAILQAAWSTMPVFPDVKPALARLRAAGFKLGVLTNCDNDLFAQTQRSFERPFDLVITAEDVRDYKPSHAHWHRFWRESGADRAHWVHVACSWFHDIAPARDFGIKRIWLDRDRTGESASAASSRITSAAELPQAIGQLQD